VYNLFSFCDQGSTDDDGWSVADVAPGDTGRVRCFEGVKDRTMSDHLLDEIAGSAEKVSSAMQVIMLAEPIRKRLLSTLQQQVMLRSPASASKFLIIPGSGTLP
jgi:hypothetical protein